MYNRYIRNDNGVYDRVPQQETAPPSPPRPQPPPPRPGPPPPGPEPAPPPAPAPERQFLNRLLAKLHLGDMDAGDLLLLLILFFLFYQKAEGKRFLSALSGRDRQLADLLNSAEPVPNGWGRILLAACSLLPGQKGRYYSCKKMLAEHFSQICPNGFQKENASLEEPFDTSPPSL